MVLHRNIPGGIKSSIACFVHLQLQAALVRTLHKETTGLNDIKSRLDTFDGPDCLDTVFHLWYTMFWCLRVLHCLKYWVTHVSIFSCDQAALQMVFSVCPSVRLSVCPSVRPSVTPFWLCSHHRIIMKFSGVITSDRSDVHAKGQGQRSKVKVTEVTTQLYRFRTVTPVWIHVWWWNYAYSLIMLRRGALLFFKVICQISRSHGSKNRRIWPRLGVSGL